MTTQSHTYKPDDALKVPTTGWPVELMQDQCGELSRWFASRPDARMRVREVAAEIARSTHTEAGNG